MSVTCTRRVQFAAGHRVMNHESKCAHLHGHNYIVHLEAEVIQGPIEVIDEDGNIPRAIAEGEEHSVHWTDPIGRVIDFSVLKQVMGDWIETHWDHGFLLHTEDVAGKTALAEFNNQMIATGQWRLPQTQKVYYFPFNPTAENLAEYLLTRIGPSLLAEYGVRLITVTVYETPNCSATARLEH